MTKYCRQVPLTTGQLSLFPFVICKILALFFSTLWNCIKERMRLMQKHPCETVILGSSEPKYTVVPSILKGKWKTKTSFGIKKAEKGHFPLRRDNKADISSISPFISLKAKQSYRPRRARTSFVQHLVTVLSLHYSVSGSICGHSGLSLLGLYSDKRCFSMRTWVLSPDQCLRQKAEAIYKPN